MAHRASGPGGSDNGCGDRPGTCGDQAESLSRMHRKEVVQGAEQEARSNLRVLVVTDAQLAGIWPGHAHASAVPANPREPYCGGASERACSKAHAFVRLRQVS